MSSKPKTNRYCMRLRKVRQNYIQKRNAGNFTIPFNASSYQ